MTQIVCFEGFVLADHDDGTDVPLGLYPAGACIIPWTDGEAPQLPCSPAAPPPDAEAMETPDGLAQHGVQHRYAETRYAPVPTTPDQLRAYAASVRYYRSIAGITVGAASYATDSASADGLAAKAARVDPKAKLSWKAASGFVTLTGADLKAVSDRIDAYRDACFLAEAEAGAGIADGSVKTMADIDAVVGAVKA